MNKEFEFLKIINNTVPSKYLGNDCAYLEEYNLAVSSDSLIEDVHFSRLYMTAYEIAQKALLVNISDILASGAKPKYFSINLSGNLNNEFIKEFYEGIKDVSDEYDIKLIGGDLTKSDKIMISVTIMGDYKNRKISSRYSAQPDYIIAVAGEFGASAQGFYNLTHKIKEDYFINIHKKPVLHSDISSQIALCAQYPYAMMDSSDGLFDCLYQIADKSKIKINVDYSKIPHKTQNKDFVLYGGEDYSLVLALHKEDFKNIKGLISIGYAEEGKEVYIDNLKMRYKSYKHFN